MRKRTKYLIRSEEYSHVRLFRDDYELLVNLLKEEGLSVNVTVDEDVLDNPEEIDCIQRQWADFLYIEGTFPREAGRVYPTRKDAIEIVVRRGVASLRSVLLDAKCRGITEDVHNLLKRNRRWTRVLSSWAPSVALFSSGSLIASSFMVTQTKPNKAMLFLMLGLIVASVPPALLRLFGWPILDCEESSWWIRLCAPPPFVLKRRADVAGIWKRNKESVLVDAVKELLKIGVTFAAGYFFRLLSA